MPNWLKDAVFYEIYPQTYCDTNGDGIIDINDATHLQKFLAEFEGVVLGMVAF